VWCAHEPLLLEHIQQLPALGTLWFRTCSTFQGAAGQSFAEAVSRHTGARVAAHTFIIGPWQSGLRTLRPGQAPTWSRDEGRDKDGRALWSGPLQPRTVTCLHASIPKGW
jgi:hypothetical protein